MKWLIPMLLAGCAAVADDPNPDRQIYKCRVLNQYLICAPERAIA
jgi:hypothetical protein